MARTTKEMIEVMTAYEEGKKITCLNKYGIKLCDYYKPEEPTEPSWNWLDYNYQVCEEPKYRPYKDTEEMINDFCERSGAKRSTMGEPYIWVKDGKTKVLIDRIGKCTVWTNRYNWTMQQLFDSLTYCDGSPCGKKE